jgi:hypothetical protein
MIIYVSIGLLQGLIHEVLRRTVITHKRLFWWDISGRIGAYFIYILCAAIILILPFYLVMQSPNPPIWEEVVWYWIGGLVLGIIISRFFVRKK